MEYVYKLFTRYKDVDQMGYVHNSVYQVYFEEGRIDMTRSTGFSYGDLENAGVLLPISEAKYNYKTPIFYGEEVEVHVWIEYIKTFSAKICYCITKDNGATECATGYTIHAVIDKQTKDFCEVPDIAKERWSKFIGKK